MQPVTKEEVELMIEKGILKCVRGRYQGLITGSKEKHGKGKPRFVEEPLYYRLYPHLKQKVDK